jgi:hypothetical protein
MALPLAVRQLQRHCGSCWRRLSVPTASLAGGIGRTGGRGPGGSSPADGGRAPRADSGLRDDQAAGRGRGRAAGRGGRRILRRARLPRLRQGRQPARLLGCGPPTGWRATAAHAAPRASGWSSPHACRAHVCGCRTRITALPRCGVARAGSRQAVPQRPCKVTASRTVVEAFAPMHACT